MKSQKIKTAPTLLIGLGGCGSKIISHVAEFVTGEQRKNIEFVAVDTDVNELRTITTEKPFVRSIQISSKLTVGEYLEINQRARDTWFPVNRMLNSKVLSEGAGQVRAVSRLAFETAILEGKMSVLHEAIDNLYKVQLDDEPQAMRVIIASSLAGGTGSGIILPMGLYVKNYLNSHFKQNSCIIRGFFMLPEIFDGVIKSEGGKNNLRCNAYATLRELDAFLMKGDGSLDEEYANTVKIEFPSQWSDEYEEYPVRPYDYCFLYDAQNTDGTKFNPANKELYERHAASCIYAQSIGPMNKRSNSSEDNTIISLAAEQGRNRYAGAGSSTLIYPVEDVKKYVGLAWTKKMVDKNWLYYDAEYAKQLETDEKNREKGLPVPEREFGRFYIESVKRDAEKGYSLATMISNSSKLFSADKNEELGDKSRAYVKALMAKAKSIEEKTEDRFLVKAKKDALSANDFDGDSNAFDEGDATAWSKFKDLDAQVRNFEEKARIHTEDVAMDVATSLIWAPNEELINSKEEYNLYYHLKDRNGKFLHPCAVRYLLCQIKEELIIQKGAIQKNIDKCDRSMERFNKSFDNPDTDVKEDVSSVANKKVPYLNRIMKTLSEEQKTLKEGYSGYINAIEENKTSKVQLKTCEEAIEYFDRLIKTYELFFDMLRTRIAGIEKEANVIERKYVIRDGIHTRFVCASPDCLKAMVEKYSANSLTSVSSELAGNIFKLVHTYAVDEKNVKPASFFDTLFDEDIVGYYKSLVDQEHGRELNVNVIGAIENEGTILIKDFDKKDDQEKEMLLREYLTKIITEAKNLAVPYIETPIGVSKEVICSCTFGENIKPKADDFSNKADIIRKHLVDYGSVPDPSLGEEDEPVQNDRIIFYQAIYGLRANELSKFAPASNTLTHSRSCGEYHRAYFNRIRNLNPDMEKSLSITPHIDRWWHVCSKMPDLDDGNQLAQEEKINAAFFWALFNDYVHFSKDGDKSVYSVNTDMLEMDGGKSNIIVSNGTKCDQLFELVDALAIYPELTSRIIETVEKEIWDEVQDTGIDLKEDGVLPRGLKNFTVDQFPLVKEKDGKTLSSVRSIFELSLLIRRSAKGASYYASEDGAIAVLNAELKELNKYARRIEREDRAAEYTGELISSQVDLLLENVEAEKNKYKDIYGSLFFNRICSTITRYLDEIGLRKLRAEIDGKFKTAIRNGSSAQQA